MKDNSKFFKLSNIIGILTYTILLLCQGFKNIFIYIFNLFYFIIFKVNFIYLLFKICLFLFYLLFIFLKILLYLFIYYINFFYLLFEATIFFSTSLPNQQTGIY